MKASAIVTVLACTVSIGFIGWRVQASRHQHVNHFGILHDPSGSYTEGCESTAGAAAQILKSPAVSANSTLAVLALGDRNTANEPQQLAAYSIPTSRKVIEGRKAIARRQADLLKDVLSRCRTARPTSISPIFLGVKQAIADLRGKGCGLGSQCELWVTSDLEENVETGIKNRLNNGDKKRPLPSPLNNEGIEVVFCGLASTAGSITDVEGRELHKFPIRDPGREDRIVQTWRSLFTTPKSVRFEPYCPKLDLLSQSGSEL